MDEISSRLDELDREGKIELEQTEENEEIYWTEDINEELTERYNKSAMKGSVVKVFYTDDETYFLEFENEADAKLAKEPLEYWENEHRYDEWYITVKGTIVIFGEKATVDLVLNAETKKPSSGSNNGVGEKNLVGKWEIVSQVNDEGEKTNYSLDTIKIYGDGTCTLEGELGTWKVVDGELMILGSYGGRFAYSDSIIGEFSCSGDTLKFFGAQIDEKENSVDLVYRKVD